MTSVKNNSKKKKILMLSLSPVLAPYLSKLLYLEFRVIVLIQNKKLKLLYPLQPMDHENDLLVYRPDVIPKGPVKKTTIRFVIHELQDNVILVCLQNFQHDTFCQSTLHSNYCIYINSLLCIQIFVSSTNYCTVEAQITSLICSRIKLVKQKTCDSGLVVP